MSTNRPTGRRTALTAAAAALILAAPGGAVTAASVEPAHSAGMTMRVLTQADEHNQADVTFAQRMIPHHRQAIVMAQMARSHGSSPEVRALAERIQKAQAPEIRTMTGWLRAWGEPVPRGMGSMEDMAGMGQDDDDATSMPGMMHRTQMVDLNRASGRAFDTMFLTMMIEHHEGAIDMAQYELRHGSYSPTKDLATDIIRSQTAEIAQMSAMLKAR
ncbi:DUF305 domain-containing protein [Streptomyces sp. NPDC085524]|uniref:DUF305 domain-containing protein n=1 Tax=Streptomyces sp. NPDC085524 TaxID=3365728 RepID=UPI0037D6C8FE